MLVYRVEGRDGRGPNGSRAYPDNAPFSAHLREFSGNQKFPVPWADTHRIGDRPVRLDWATHDPRVADVCGAANLHQLRQWFDKSDRMYLSRYGFAVKVYDVPDEAVSVLTTQVVFARAKANLVETLDVVDLHPISADTDQPLLEKAA